MPIRVSAARGACGRCRNGSKGACDHRNSNCRVGCAHARVGRIVSAFLRRAANRKKLTCLSLRLRLARAMNKSRRQILLESAAVAVGMASMARADEPSSSAARRVSKAELDRILDEPVLKTDFLKAPVTVASIELLRNGKTFLVRVRSTDGVEAITVPNS